MNTINKDLASKDAIVDTQVELAGLTLSNPVIPASGTFGFGAEFAKWYDLDILGSISVKGTTREPRFGNPTPRIAECAEGLINSVGLQNPGIDYVVANSFRELSERYHKPVIANISGFSVDEFAECCRKVNDVPNVGIIEVNISCPNVHNGGMAFGTSAKAAAEVTAAVKKVTTKPVFVKLSPNVTDITEIARACEESGADGLTLINTMLGMRIDIRRRRPVVANKMGGFSGPAILPIALRMVYQVTGCCSIPVIGCGGIATAENVIEMMMAGAKAVQVGAQNLVDPFACKKIIEDLPRIMRSLGIASLREIERV